MVPKEEPQELVYWSPGSGTMTDSHSSGSVGSYNSSFPTTSAWNITGSGPWLLAFMLTVIILMTVCGNVLLIALVFAHRSLRCTSNCFLVSLFLSDLMVALVVMPPAMLNVLCGAWVLWPAFCPIWLCFDVMCCSASILNLCVISLDRYLFIISPLRYKQRMTPPRALLLVGAAWGLAALASFLPIEMRWHSLGLGNGHSPVPGVSSSNISSYSDTLYPASYFQLSPPGGLSFQCRLGVTLPFAFVASVLTFFLPSSAICFTYCRILLAARRQAKRVAALSHPPHPHPSLGEPSRPPSPGIAAAQAQRDGDDCGYQEPPVSQNAPVRKTAQYVNSDTVKELLRGHIMISRLVNNKSVITTSSRRQQRRIYSTFKGCSVYECWPTHKTKHRTISRLKWDCKWSRQNVVFLKAFFLTFLGPTPTLIFCVFQVQKYYWLHVCVLSGLFTGCLQGRWDEDALKNLFIIIRLLKKNGSEETVWKMFCSSVNFTQKSIKDETL